MVAETLGDLLAYVAEWVEEHGADCPMYSMTDGEISSGAEFYLDRLTGFQIPGDRYTGDTFVDSGYDVVGEASDRGIDYSEVVAIDGVEIPDWR